MYIFRRGKLSHEVHTYYTIWVMLLCYHNITCYVLFHTHCIRTHILASKSHTRCIIQQLTQTRCVVTLTLSNGWTSPSLATHDHQAAMCQNITISIIFPTDRRIVRTVSLVRCFRRHTGEGALLFINKCTQIEIYTKPHKPQTHTHVESYVWMNMKPKLAGREMLNHLPAAPLYPKEIRKANWKAFGVCKYIQSKARDLLGVRVDVVVVLAAQSLEASGEVGKGVAPYIYIWVCEWRCTRFMCHT